MASVPFASLSLKEAPSFLLDRKQTASHIGDLARSTICHLDPQLPYTDQSHQHDEMIQKSTINWIKRFKIIPEGELLKKIAGSNFGIFIGKCHPSGNLETVTTVALFATWLFIYDDMIEKKTDEIASLHERSIRILNGGKAEDEDMPLMKGLQYIAERIGHKNPTLIWKERYIAELSSYCRSTQFESENRLQKRVPTLREYLIERPEFSGTKVMFAFVELIEELSIPDDVYVSPLMKRVLLLAANAVNWENDILSAQKEFLNDDVHNLIFVLQKENNCTIDEAFECGRIMFEENQKELLQCVEDATKENKEIQRYVKGVMDWLSGHHYWAKVSPRYSSFFTSPRPVRRGEI